MHTFKIYIYMYIHRYKPYNGDVTQGEPFDQAFMGEDEMGYIMMYIYTYYNQQLWDI